MSHQAQVPGPIADYFGTGRRPLFEDHPVITRQFKPDTGWTIYPFRKRARPTGCGRCAARVSRWSR